MNKFFFITTAVILLIIPALCSEKEPIALVVEEEHSVVLDEPKKEFNASAQDALKDQIVLDAGKELENENVQNRDIDQASVNKNKPASILAPQNLANELENKKASTAVLPDNQANSDEKNEGSSDVYILWGGVALVGIFVFGCAVYIFLKIIRAIWFCFIRFIGFLDKGQFNSIQDQASSLEQTSIWFQMCGV